MENEAERTTVEEASLAGVSGQFFVNLSETERIPFYRVWIDRRVYGNGRLAIRALPANCSFGI